jgi:BASS family bile acid:Na+ symporter
MSADTLLLVVKLALLGGIVLTVAAVGLGATMNDATSLFREPGLLIRSVLSMSVLAPIVACVMARAFDLHPAVRIALVALAVSPVPPFLPKKEVTAGGEASYVIGLLTATALFSIVLVPVTLVGLARVFDVPLEISITRVASAVTMTVLGPLLVGIGIHALAPNVAPRVARPVGLVAAILLVLGLVAILVKIGPDLWALVGNGTLVAMAAFSIIGVIIGHALGGPVLGNRAALGLSTATRHPGVALAIATANFPDQTLALPAILLFAIVGAVVSVPYVKWMKSRTSPTQRGLR